MKLFCFRLAAAVAIFVVAGAAYPAAALEK